MVFCTEFESRCVGRVYGVHGTIRTAHTTYTAALKTTLLTYLLTYLLHGVESFLSS